MKNHYSGKTQKRFFVYIMDYNDPKKLYKIVPFGNSEKAHLFLERILKEGIKAKLKTRIVDLGEEYKEFGGVGKWISKD